MGKLRRHLRLLERFQEKTDHHHAEQIVKHAAESGVPSCSAGCADCCQQLVWCELLEAQQIIDRYPDVVADVRDALLAQAALCDSLPSEVRFAQSGWWKAREWCAFLDPTTKRCRIYPVRPITCRTHFVISDPSRCGRLDGEADDASHPVVMLDVGGTKYAAPQYVMRVGAAYRAEPGAKKSASMWGPLPLIFRLALTGLESPE